MRNSKFFTALNIAFFAFAFLSFQFTNTSPPSPNKAEEPVIYATTVGGNGAGIYNIEVGEENGTPVRVRIEVLDFCGKNSR